jgi:hypothetical protein
MYGSPGGHKSDTLALCFNPRALSTPVAPDTPLPLAEKEINRCAEASGRGMIRIIQKE